MVGPTRHMKLKEGSVLSALTEEDIESRAAGTNFSVGGIASVFSTRSRAAGDRSVVAIPIEG